MCRRLWLTFLVELASGHMKRCSYCGRENADEATNCRECGTELARPLLRRKRASLRRRAKSLRWRMDRSFRLGSIAMLPAGLILLVSAIVEFTSGDYGIGRNRFGEPVGPFFRLVLGLVFSCAGGAALWYHLRRPKQSEAPDERPQF